ncbi:MAG: trypsin-like peptidase domain-containing protein [Desulfobulbus sp.]|jgi:S1-C subfamily serine protease|uniref:S1C family serine protease n=1 Tax=Desulfobulbus sp. TaxID=895 RepID=UPI00284BD20C|nr:trypsin-like peptidase domain-containing protein [Desulfobulbus sp.]MDR2549974.1 trypsin-like peptidase domain-containing protein [Desulfobulbus sp.]
MKALYVVLIAGAIGWLLLQTFQPSPRDPRAVSRPIEARGDLAADEKNTIEIFRSAAPSVVYITSIAVRRNLFSLNVYEIPQGTGSGFIWDQQGRIVTNYHVISDASRLEVTLADHSTWKAVLVGTAPDRDLAVVQINAPADKLRPIAIGESKNLLVGQKVFAIGNPFGLDQTLTTGIVSALGREITAATGRTIHDVIQTDAAINPGNSGGPLLDSAGRLIGVNTAIYSPSGGSSGIGFAVPSSEVNRVVPQIIAKGKLIRPGLGIALANRRLTEELGLDGVMILKVLPGSTAEKAGLRGASQVRDGLVLGDIILAVNGKPVKDYDTLRDELERYEVGQNVTLTLMRDSTAVEVKVPLEAMN